MFASFALSLITHGHNIASDSFFPFSKFLYNIEHDIFFLSFGFVTDKERRNLIKFILGLECCVWQRFNIWDVIK